MWASQSLDELCWFLLVQLNLCAPALCQLHSLGCVCSWGAHRGCVPSGHPAHWPEPLGCDCACSVMGSCPKPVKALLGGGVISCFYHFLELGSVASKGTCYWSRRLHRALNCSLLRARNAYWISFYVFSNILLRRTNWAWALTGVLLSSPWDFIGKEDKGGPQGKVFVCVFQLAILESCSVNLKCLKKKKPMNLSFAIPSPSFSSEWEGKQYERSVWSVMTSRLFKETTAFVF